MDTFNDCAFGGKLLHVNGLKKRASLHLLPPPLGHALM
jgi:hypothetical protein